MIHGCAHERVPVCFVPKFFSSFH